MSRTRLLTLAARRAARLTARPTITDGSAPVPLDHVISPLRYDVVVRERFLRFLAAQGDPLDIDVDAVVAAARDQEYHAWFRHVAIHHVRPGTAREADLEAAFRRRVVQTANLLGSFSARGFDARYPVTLRTAGAGPVTTSTGKRLTGRLYASDGCHRLALLRMAGETVLRPEWYQVRTDPRWAPPDNTGALIPVLGISRAEHLAFVASGYTTAAVGDAAALLAHLAETGPAAAAEVAGLLALDAPLLERSPQA